MAELLVEVLSEELPPKSLRALSQAFAERVALGLERTGLSGRGTARVYATPRRLAFSIPDVVERAADRDTEVSGPSAQAPAQAIAGFARKHGITPEQLVQRHSPKGPIVVAKLRVKGAALAESLAAMVEEALKALPIPKMMRWGSGDAQFVRPVHGLVMMHGDRVVPGQVFGIDAGRHTQGHRFMGKRTIQLLRAEAYAEQLQSDGCVIAEFDARRREIDRQLQACAAGEQASLGGHADLLEEVTALVEFPQVYAGGFAAQYLEVPQECLILTMRQNQKYFPLFDAAGKLKPRFLIVSNMKVDDPRHIVHGNERVVRPRLEDARFFYQQDRRQRLEARVPQLAKVVYHRKLGSQLERVERLQLLAGAIARRLHADVPLTERAAWLAKADLLSGMVGEFPELQGVMGRYYALHDGEPAVLADAIEAHYRPRFAGDALPQTAMACAVALADKLDALAGLFSVGEMPTGEKDPFGLRRAALGTVRILVERKLPLELPFLLDAAAAPFQGKARRELEAFVFDRARSHFRDAGYSANEVEAVLSLLPPRLDLAPSQLEAVRAFASLPEAESLAAANKRVGNILRQAHAKGESFAGADAAVLKEPAERALFEALRASARHAAPLLDKGDYTGYLRTFAVLKSPVDAFFDSVMVMVDEAALRRNRLGLLHDLQQSMNRIADLSKLAK